jgi:hypothetical protein
VSSTVAKPLKMTVVEKSGRSFHLNSISSQLEDGALIIDIDTSDILLNLGAKLLPTDPEVVRFKNRGNWYNPPRQHLKERIGDFHPVYIASLGLQFYRSYVCDSELWIEKG